MPNKSSRPKFEITISGCKTRIGERTLVMGILNVTPDSFSDGMRYADPKRALARALELIHQGADWIDVGGESTRPGAQPVPEEEELRRVLPAIRAIRRKAPQIPISIDTTKAKVAELAVAAGANIINDISGLRFDPGIAKVARSHKVPLILMHTRSRPETMQNQPFARDIWVSILRGIETSIRRALAAGMKHSQLILDPGLGFGKPRRQNYEIIARLAKLQRFGMPILVGASRKSFVKAVVRGEGLEPSPSMPTGSKPAEDPRDQALLPIGDAAFVTAAILAGANIVRVHEPATIIPAVRVADAVLAAR